MKTTIQKSTFINEKGLTVKELKHMINNTPEVSESGEPFEVLVQIENNIPSKAKSVYAHNGRKDGCDILLSYE